VALLYEGEFQSIMLLPSEIIRYSGPTPGEEYSAGPFRYRLLPDFMRQSFGLAAQVYRPETPDKWVLLLLVDEYATRAEREATIQQVIASLTPVTEQTLPVLRPKFEGLDAAAGQG